ncbi:MAG: class I SAM-dependent methyltransferase [Candidatus Thorarchaeota archaeon]|nr:class I SAM-dependent methyltransferase [Candidatus Thorarchaeota archaeon]
MKSRILSEELDSFMVGSLITTQNEVLVPRTWGTYWDKFGETLVRLLEIREGAHVLDIGTGGGSTLFPASRRVGPTGKVTGVELCEHCVGRTNGEIARCGISNAEVHPIDARTMDFPDASFDYVIAGFIGCDDYFDFTTNTFVAEDVLTKQIVRVLKPGGRFGLSTWLVQEDLDWMKRFFNDHGLECRTNYHAEHEDGWRAIMRAAGLEDLWFLEEAYRYTYPTLELWWKEMLDYDWFEGQKNSDVIDESMVQDAHRRIKKHATENGCIRFGRKAIFLTARRA